MTLGKSGAMIDGSFADYSLVRHEKNEIKMRLNPIDRRRLEIEREKLKLERTNLLTELRAQVLNEGMKGLLLINGGGAIALATWLQAVWGESWAAPMLSWQLYGIACFAMGIFIGGFVPLARYLGSLHKYTATPRKNPWWWTHLFATMLSLFCFASASGLVVWGGLEALKKPVALSPNVSAQPIPKSGPLGVKPNVPENQP